MAQISRRELLRAGAAAGMLVFTPLGSLAQAWAVPADARWLTDDELALLRGLVDRFLPGPPEDPSPGAVQAGCAEAIDALLGAFEVDPPLVYAGGPFSDRAGHPVNRFAEFLPLDPYEQKAWRLRILGSGGDPALEFNGPVVGLQQHYRDGLAALAASRFDPDLPGPLRDLALEDARQDPKVATLVSIATVHTMEFMYGPPEYGGNRDLVAWETIAFDGDVHPRGYTDEQVEQLDPGDEADTLVLPPGFSIEDVLPVMALATSDAAANIVASAGGRMDVLREYLRPLREGR